MLDNNDDVDDAITAAATVEAVIAKRKPNV